MLKKFTSCKSSMIRHNFLLLIRTRKPALKWMTSPLCNCNLPSAIFLGNNYILGYLPSVRLTITSIWLISVSTPCSQTWILVMPSFITIMTCNFLHVAPATVAWLLSSLDLYKPSLKAVTQVTFNILHLCRILALAAKEHLPKDTAGSKWCLTHQISNINRSIYAL